MCQSESSRYSGHPGVANPPTMSSVSNETSVLAPRGRGRTNDSVRIYGTPANPTPVYSDSSGRIYAEPTTRAPVQGAPNVRNVTSGERDRGTTESDRRLVREIRQAWLDDSALAPSTSRVNVSVRDGKAVLTGSVPTMEERKGLHPLAAQTRGVVSVEGRLEVKPQPWPHDLA